MQKASDLNSNWLFNPPIQHEDIRFGNCLSKYSSFIVDEPISRYLKYKPTLPTTCLNSFRLRELFEILSR